MTIRFQSYRVGAPARVSLGESGIELGQEARNARFSHDGRSLVFETIAALLPDDRNGTVDLYERDLVTGRLTRWSSTLLGEPGSGASMNARYGPGGLSTFDSASWNLTDMRDLNGVRDVFVRDRATGLATLVSVTAAGVQGNGESSNGILSPDARLVLFESLATNLVGVDSNGARDLFLKSLDDNSLVRVSVSAAGAQANGQSGGGSFSPDGRHVLFESNASNLIDGDSNAAYDIFLKDLATGAVTRVSVAVGGAQANGHSFRASFTPDGRSVLFESEASNLVANDTNGVRDIFLRDLATGVVTRVSEGEGGTQLNGTSQNASIAAGRVAFESDANNAVSGDRNARRDVFVKDLDTGVLHRLSVGADGAEPDAGSFNARIAPDGRSFVYESDSTNLVGGDHNGQRDLFVTTLEHGQPGAKLGADGSPATGALFFTATEGARVAVAWAEAPAGALGTLTLSLVADAAGVQAGKLRWTYAPGDAWRALPAEAERVETHRIVVRDGAGLETSAELTLRVHGANDAPVAAPDEVRLSAGATLDVTALLLANDSDPDTGDLLTIVAVTGAGAGSALLDVDTGRVTYRADGAAAMAVGAGATLIDRFAYTVRDRVGATATATVTITIEGVHATVGEIVGTPMADVLVATGTGPAHLRGLGGRDHLTGGPGNDTLDGGAGVDTMAGGAGDDVYIYDQSGDLVIELPGGGWDTVRVALSGYRLPAEVEELIFTGPPSASGYDGKGNAGANRMTGGAGPDRLYGFEGNDTLLGGAGRDYLEGGSGDDWLDGGPDADTYRGGAGADVFVLRRGEAAGDLIQDFRSGEGDRLLLDGWGPGTVLTYDAGTRMLRLTDPADGYSEALSVVGDPSMASAFFG